MIIHQKTPAHKTPRWHETPMIHPWLRHTSFDTKFWDSIKLMNPCVFCWSQYLRVLRLSCLSCSIVVIMIVTSIQTDRQSIYCVCHEWLNDAIHGPMGEISTPKTAHKATRKFHAIWCLSHSVLWSSWINHQWMMNHHPLSFPPWLPCRNCFPLVLVERWRTEAFSRWGYTPPCPTKKGHTQAYSGAV